MVPVERETVQRHDVNLIERAFCLKVLNERRIDRRDAAEHARQGRVRGADGLRGAGRHLGEQPPVRIEFRVPMRLVVGLVPDHRGFDHARVPRAG